ncbi:MAG TPA: aminotransferase class I/II-fold pyridoxal phosphate-dependent enzyme [Planctomycetota bacterium]|nr:aminotransferase class I/II-fold pyridoxal phosphate-dependent enzyme [Planctomycetota bacterium]
MPANRLQKLRPYPFAALRKTIAEARKAGKEVLNLGIGDPDRPTPDPVVRELCRAVRDKADLSRHRYGCDVPTAEFPQAVKDFYRRRFGVALADDQIVQTSGSKDAIVQLAMGVLNPGDLAIAPEPGYPTYNIGHTFASAVTHYVPLLRENGFLPDLDAIPAEVRRLAKVMWLNYPNNPTTAVCDVGFYRRVVEFARKNGLLIANDLAYSENTYDGYVAPSILQVGGAADVAVEFFSLSKAFCMTGWRVGMAVGHPGALKALALVKDNSDNGTLRAIQFAGAKALDLAEQLTPKINAVYRRRRDLVVTTLSGLGWDLEKPKGTIYIWAAVPARFHGDSAAFASDLFEKSGVVVTPGAVYGQHGEGYFRMSLTYPDEVLSRGMARLAERR